MKYPSYNHAKYLRKRKEVSEYLCGVSEVKVWRERYRAERQNTANLDTEMRQGIHELIDNCLKEGKTDDEILVELDSKYMGSGLEKFFKGYIEHHRSKMEKNKGDEGR